MNATRKDNQASGVTEGAFSGTMAPAVQEAEGAEPPAPTLEEYADLVATLAVADEYFGKAIVNRDKAQGAFLALRGDSLASPETVEEAKRSLGRATLSLTQARTAMNAARYAVYVADKLISQQVD